MFDYGAKRQVEYGRIRVGERLRQLRERAGLSQRSLARRLNRDSSDISRWESGKYKIDADLLPVIAAELGADVCEFFREVEPSHRRVAELKGRYRALSRADAFSDELAVALERLSPSDRQTAEMLLSVLDNLLARSA